jgi:hypothetical protein
MELAYKHVSIFVIRSILPVPIHLRQMLSKTRQIYKGDQIKEDEFGGACSTHWGEAYMGF